MERDQQPDKPTTVVIGGREIELVGEYAVTQGRCPSTLRLDGENWYVLVRDEKPILYQDLESFQRIQDSS